ncbi:hypothetical protein PIB30_069776 [Stylosanthes scabra]|uniref:Uncharacterized protein n=1 Tax=Stylosanthes scabra TaxID=79078 RepID=A0ABU6QQG6_9FABA|nr:hypothetical protein [Stylosanthes scabra]
MQQQYQYDLVELVIENSCDSLTSFPLELFPKLELLQIRKYANLESLSMSRSQHTALHCLVISKCPNFESFPREGLAMPNLAYFVVMKCYKVKSLPCHMNVFLPSLKFLNIYGCPGIHAFPEGGLPPNLQKLSVGGCDTQLRSLSSMENFEALTRLNIEGAECDSMKSFPMLTIDECPKLEKMTGEKLPSSLLQLKIDYCPSLTELYEMKDPQVWAKVSHVPKIEVNGKQIL